MRTLPNILNLLVKDWNTNSNLISLCKFEVNHIILFWLMVNGYCMHFVHRTILNNNQNGIANTTQNTISSIFSNKTRYRRGWFSWVFIIYNLNAHASTLNELYYSISISYEILFYEMHFGFSLSSCAISMGNPVNECTKVK